ncbi:hyaluronidase PH-20 precursor [Triplophysa rosa]|uniref:Hyaluronidase n=2 Tax=Triplophysa rosa TaxID=992332 RepID=A0A9W7WZZ9_TRIRA|nr:hyaluronidase PH-20 precursor [Triplophysa rosa]
MQMGTQGKHIRLIFHMISIIFGHICTSSSLLPTTVPLFNERPFVLLWNAPISKCQQLKVPLDLSLFQAVTTPARVRNQSLTLFYKNRIGLFPYIDLQPSKEYNGGIPQRGNLSASLDKAKEEFTQYISDSSSGLAVMDWEEWLPMYDRNFDIKEIYKDLSINYTLKHNSSLNTQQAGSKAKQQFQEAARGYMEETLTLGVALRPQYLWGYYLFPDCYNYDFEDENYTGVCSEHTKQLNNELFWLWETSTALYPSAYLPTSTSGSKKAALFVRHQVQEAVRVAGLSKHPYAAPVYVYLRPLLRDQRELYMNEIDLVSSIGESAALGAAGSVLWGASADFTNKASCEALSAYLSDTLNPYIANVTTAAHFCSKGLCHGNGRCVRKNSDSDDYLHLSPERHQIRRNAGKYMVMGTPSLDDLTYWADKFTCQCYEDRKCSVKITP